MTPTDITTPADINALVHTFYGRARHDDLLGPIFNRVIPADAWEEHLAQIARFWTGILLHERGYQGDPMSKHLKLPLSDDHFLRWLSLFHQTIDELFSGPVADEAKVRANGIARIMAALLHLPADAAVFARPISS